MINKLNVNATTFPVVSAEQKVQRPVVDESKISGSLQKTNISSNGTMYMDGECPLSFGVIVSSEYGFASQLDEVSREYMLARKTDNYSEMSASDVITNLQDKYSELKNNITDNYSGNEAESRIKVLDNIFDTIIQQGILKPIQQDIATEMTSNRLRAKLGPSIDTSSGNKWNNTLAAIDEQTKTLKELSEKFAEALRDIQNKDTANYADSLLKTITEGLASIQEKKKGFRAELDADSDEKAKKVWNLVEKKIEIFKKSYGPYTSDEEKYKAFLDGQRSLSGIDEQIKSILENKKEMYFRSNT